jgi:putative spermidine/putrescine transport system substrate-binding protein
MKLHAAKWLAVAVTVTLTLAGCSTAAKTPGGTALDKLGKTEGTLTLLGWPGYAEDGSNDPKVDWVTPFEQQTGCQVTFKSYGTSDEALSLFKTGQYDAIAASGDATLRLIAGGYVQPLNTSLIPSYKNVYSFLKGRAWNTVDGKTYGVPHGYGANLLMYNTDVVKPAPTSWSVVFDGAGAYKGKVTAYDSPIYIADAALYLMAHKPELGIKNPYALDTTQLAAAVDLLKAQRQNVGEYWSDYLKSIQSFSTGNTVVGTTWQVIKNSMPANAHVDVTLPTEGATGWSDSWMVSSTTKHVNCAYKWLDYIDSPKANAAATEYFGEAPVTQDACQFASDANFCASYHAGDEAYAAKIWYWTTPISKCLDGRTNTKCTDYAAWTKAWQDIKG